MTRLHYISPSLLPSRSANSAHVMHQCDGFARAGIDISLYAKRAITNADDLPEALRKNYGVNVQNWNLRTFQSDFSRADTLRIALMALKPVLLAPRGELVLSRNLYAALILASARKKMLFETHQLEYGARKTMQRAIMTCPWVTTVAISHSLVHHLTLHHGIAPSRPLVLHDAAPRGMCPIAPEMRGDRLSVLVPEARGEWLARCAYFGHLYPGRGIEIIKAMAEARPDILFLVFGGNDSDVAQQRADNKLSNLHFLGHIPHPTIRQVMVAVDILLMPYQTSVSIGLAGHDTARWMSPMKMFEYLASGVPIISSDLPVLREVLEDCRNALLVAPDNPDAWVSAVDRLVNDPKLARRLGDTGHADYLARYTWDQRAHSLLAVAEAF